MCSCLNFRQDPAEHHQYRANDYAAHRSEEDGDDTGPGEAASCGLATLSRMVGSRYNYRAVTQPVEYSREMSLEPQGIKILVLEIYIN